MIATVVATAVATVVAAAADMADVKAAVDTAVWERTIPENVDVRQADMAGEVGTKDKTAPPPTSDGCTGEPDADTSVIPIR